MAWMGGWFDPELEELFRDDPELLETAQQVRAARPQAEPDPRFRNRLARPAARRGFSWRRSARVAALVASRAGPFRMGRRGRRRRR